MHKEDARIAGSGLCGDMREEILAVGQICSYEDKRRTYKSDSLRMAEGGGAHCDVLLFPINMRRKGQAGGDGGHSPV